MILGRRSGEDDLLTWELCGSCVSPSMYGTCADVASGCVRCMCPAPDSLGQSSPSFFQELHTRDPTLNPKWAGERWSGVFLVLCL